MADEVLTPHIPTTAGRWLLVVVFVAGAALMSLELVGSRILAPSFGNSIYVWGSLIGVFLAALSVGYVAGGRLADRFPSAGALTVVLALAALLTTAAIIGSDPLQSAIVRWNLGLRLNPLVSAVVLFGPASILMGMVSPFAVRLSAADLSRMGSTAGALYGLSTVGSIVGTIGTSFWLIGQVGTETIVVLVAAALAFCAAVSGFAHGAGRSMAVGLASVVIVGLVAGSGAVGGDDQRQVGGNNSPVLRAAGFEDEFDPNGTGRQRLRTDSQYHRIRVVDYPAGAIEADRGATRLLHFDNSMQAAVELDDAGEPDTEAPPVFSYLAAVDLLPRMRPDARRALFIGLGSGAAPMRLHQLMPNVEIDVVEIDEAVVRVAEEWFGYDDAGGKIDTHVGDGRSWLAASDDRYDIVMVDAYNADSIPFHLTTREFLEVVRGHLEPDGVVLANLIGAAEGPRSSLLRSFVKTYADAFTHVSLYPVATDERGPRLRNFGNVELVATDRPPPPRAGTLAEPGLETVAADIPPHPALDRLLRHRYRALVPTDDVPLLTDDYAPVDALSIHEEDA